MSLLFSIALLAQSWCSDHRVTGFVRSDYGPYTYDGSHIMTPEPIAAASWDIPLQSLAVIEDLGPFRVADRGMLGSNAWLDVAVWTREQALAITGTRRACIFPPADRS
jgi:hypothetical protein